jgi:hypothetical protein
MIRKLQPEPGLLPMKSNSFSRRRDTATALLLLLMAMAASACLLQPAPPSPPPNPGKIIAKHSHEFYYFNIDYAVGILADGTRVVGTISNAIPTDLNQFMVHVIVKNEAGRELAKGSSGFFDVSDMDSATFVIDLPRLHGPCIFEFSCEYVYYDDMDQRRTRWLAGGESDWNNFTDKIVLP